MGASYVPAIGRVWRWWCYVVLAACNHAAGWTHTSASTVSCAHTDFDTDIVTPDARQLQSGKAA